MDIMEKDWIAVIGSRDPTDKQTMGVIRLIQSLDPETQVIISGCAHGIDEIALSTAFTMGFDTIGILPWASYNPEVQRRCTKTVVITDFTDENRNAAFQSVKDYHPSHQHLTQGAEKLHARNYGIVRWAKHVYAAPSDKPGGGGTGQGIRICQGLNIHLTIIVP